MSRLNEFLDNLHEISPYWLFTQIDMNTNNYRSRQPVNEWGKMKSVFFLLDKCKDESTSDKTDKYSSFMSDCLRMLCKFNFMCTSIAGAASMTLRERESL